MGLEYFGANPRDVPWSENEDNPLSPLFVPPKKRGKNSAARWWAFAEKNKRVKATAECAHEKVVDDKPKL